MNFRQIALPAKVGDLIGEVFIEKLQRPQRQYRGVAVIDDVGVIAIGTDDQLPVESVDQGAVGVVGAWIDGVQSAARRFSAEADAADLQAVALIDIGVIGQHVTGRADAIAIAVIGDGEGHVVGRHGGIPGTVDANVQLGDIGGAGDVAHPVGEGFHQRITDLQ
ncbi:hypothetical protein D3C78_854300 [compost metagenome]